MPSSVARLLLSSALLAAAVQSVTPAALAATPEAPAGCDAFTWNVSQELSLMRQPATPVVAATASQPAVAIAPGRHYAARLTPQADVQLAAAPGKPMLDDGAFAGLLAFQVPASGRYRVAIDSGHWIDVIDGGKVVASRDFQGQRGCEVIHKVVEFDLPAGRELLLQFSGGSAESVGVAIAAAPPA